jgi:hypothetical protein
MPTGWKPLPANFDSDCYAYNIDWAFKLLDNSTSVKALSQQINNISLVNGATYKSVCRVKSNYALWVYLDGTTDYYLVNNEGEINENTWTIITKEFTVSDTTVNLRINPSGSGSGVGNWSMIDYIKLYRVDTEISIPSVFTNNYILDSPPDYARMTPDTEFVFKYDFGEYLINILNKLLELYGYNGFFDGDGKFMFEPKAAPIKIHDNKDATGSGTKPTSIQAIGGTYHGVDASNNLTFSDVYGRSVALIVKRGTSYGNSDINENYNPYTGTANIKVEIYNDDGSGSPDQIVKTVNLNGYYYKDWEFFLIHV